MSQTIDDLIVLGRAAPEPMSDGRHTVCVGGYSPTKGYVRLYPSRVDMQSLRRWNVVSVDVTADDDDPRDESYKFTNSQSGWENLHSDVEQVGRLSKDERIQLVDNLADDCTKRLCDEQRSLGIVSPDTIYNVYLDNTGTTSVQTDLDGNEIKGKPDYPYKLYYEYRCQDCAQKTTHDQHIIEWGVYQHWEHTDNYRAVMEALKLDNHSWTHYLFVGNLRHYRRSYVIISDLRFKHSDMCAAGVRPKAMASLEAFV